jgi:nucleotide-binding universal stress UspA family protein
MQAMVRTAVAARFGPDVPPWFSAQQIEGAAAEVLIRESRDAQMLIVGSRGHGGFAGLLLGSVSSACAEHATCAVLVLHDASSPDRDETISDLGAAFDVVHAADDSRPQLALS